MPVAEVTQALARMWDGEGEDNILSKTHATQVNLILHIGDTASIDAALECFQTAVSFAQNYPCRIIVICPLENAEHNAMSAKLYSQCFIGSDLRETCCCEALILAHREQDYTFLDSQVSTWLEPDLPIYYWFHGVSPKLICDHLRFLRHCNRIIFDSSAESLDCSLYNWPKPDNLQDLAKARILPWRQSIGQILSGSNPQTLIEGLTKVEIRHSYSLKAEAKCLMEWMQKSLNSCYKASHMKSPMEVKCEVTDIHEDNLIQIEWSYETFEKSFFWEHEVKTSNGIIKIQMPLQSAVENIYVRDLKPHQVLSEAFYFNS